MTWTIKYYNIKVRQAIYGLPENLLAYYLRLAEVLETFGADAKLSEITRHRENLYSLALRDDKNYLKFNVFYCRTEEEYISILHLCKDGFPNEETLAFVEKLQLEVTSNGEARVLH